MSGDVTLVASVSGLDEVVQRFRTGGERVRAALRREVTSLGYMLQRRVEEQKLSGSVLHVRTGRLRRSINMQTKESGANISASVGTNVAYGRFWELGFRGTEQVRAHQRRTAGGSTAEVRAHTRRVNLAPRPFLAPSLEEMRGEIQARLLGAVREGI